MNAWTSVVQTGLALSFLLLLVGLAAGCSVIGIGVGEQMVRVAAIALIALVVTKKVLG